ncbi:DUF2867 domain-containing protein [Nocardia sp. NBC_00508]|uniref:DUF2867 domain-containing protein n=1 Tax=Nocardia sp. NBC_00508 TaxID=2975992 RepID=UPI002E8087F4|nr:DUF2867 domain-containing protein [Nocardia sp. NBC_00508]WUD64683.1 DUF2867 domain-containing protein [Nocardia sp. NBC_00508]
MRLPKTAHTSRPWRIHDIAPDFDVEDVWALPTPGGPDELPRLVRQVTSGDDDSQFPMVYRLLFAIRWKLGGLLGWDKPDAGLNRRVYSLRERLPEDLREGPRGPDMQGKPFHSIYLTDTEWAAELANQTVHTVMHIGWVPDDAGGYRGQMAVLVKPNGLLGKLYMVGILPFRYLGVYPALMRQVEREWRRGDRAAEKPGSGSRPRET